jgi:hypothetical protein
MPGGPRVAQEVTADRSVVTFRNIAASPPSGFARTRLPTAQKRNRKNTLEHFQCTLPLTFRNPATIPHPG